MDDDAFYKSIAGAVSPSLNDVRRQMADAGDFEGLIRAFQNAMPATWEIVDFFPLLQRAIKVAANADPAEFARRSFASMVAFTSYLALRTQLTAEQILARADRCSGYRMDERWLQTDTDPGAMRAAMDASRELQSHMANILHAQAATARLWALERQREESAQPIGNPPSSKRGTTTKTRPASSARRRQAAKTPRRPVFVARNGNAKSPKAGAA